VVALLAGLAALLLSFPAHLSLSGWLVTLAVTAAGLAGLVLAARLPLRWALVGAVGLLVGLRVAAFVLVDPPLVRDPEAYDNLARGVLAGECCWSNRPMGYPLLLATAYSLGLPGKTVTLVAGLAGGPLMWALGRRLGGERAAVVALYLYAVAPAFVLFTGVLLTEPLYATLLLAALLALPVEGALRAGSRSRPVALARSALGGLVLGVAQYIRTTAIFLAPAFVLPLVRRRAWREAALLVAVALAVLLPVIVNTGGLTTSTEAGYSLMIGANREAGGFYNADDRQLYLSWGEDRERLAREEAIRRITADPPGLLLHSLRKVEAMWSNEGYVPYFAFLDTAVALNFRHATRVIAQFFYAPVFAAAVVALWRMRREPHDLALVIVGILLTMAAIHVLVEVQGRYHLYMEPLLMLLAASLVGSARWAIWRRP
jgi:hypothetical protein